jgi:hypothetical protein
MRHDVRTRAARVLDALDQLINRFGWLTAGLVVGIAFIVLMYSALQSAARFRDRCERGGGVLVRGSYEMQCVRPSQVAP